MKVLMIGPDRSVHGGISAIVNGYHEAGLNNRIDLRYVGTMKEGSRAKKLAVAASAYLRFLCSLHNYDIIHVHLASDNSFWRKSYFIKTAHARHKKIIIHQHGGDFINYHDNLVSAAKRAEMDRVLGMADRLLVLTPSWKEYFARIVPEEKIVVMPNGIMMPAGMPRDLRLDAGRMHRILFLGRICASKGVNELLDAVGNLHAEWPDLELELGGIFETRTEADLALKSRVESAPDYVRHLGWITGEAKEKALNECGILALPSYYEGFPVTIPEAMAHGSIAVASAVGGIPEIIDDGVTGLLVAPHDADDLTLKINGILQDPAKAEVIRANACDHVREYYSMEVITDKLIEIYRSL